MAIAGIFGILVLLFFIYVLWPVIIMFLKVIYGIFVLFYCSVKREDLENVKADKENFIKGKISFSITWAVAYGILLVIFIWIAIYQYNDYINIWQYFEGTKYYELWSLLSSITLIFMCVTISNVIFYKQKLAVIKAKPKRHSGEVSAPAEKNLKEESAQITAVEKPTIYPVTNSTSYPGNDTGQINLKIDTANSISHPSNYTEQKSFTEKSAQVSGVEKSIIYPIKNDTSYNNYETRRKFPKLSDYLLDWEDEREIADIMGLPYEPPVKHYFNPGESYYDENEFDCIVEDESLDDENH